MSDTYQGYAPGHVLPNTSEQGVSAELPSGVGRLNWGAFLLSWIWGLGNGTYIALLTLLPVANVVMPFVLLFKGDQWAWQNERWRDVAHFRSVQRNWTIAAVVIYGLGLALVVGLVMLVFAVIGNLEPVETAKHEARTNPVIAQHVGSPVEVSWWFTGSVNAHQQTGEADIIIYLSGPQASGTLRTVSVRRGGVWVARKMVLTIDDTGQVIGLTPPR